MTSHVGNASEVRRARPEEAEAITEVLATAFLGDPVSDWLFPDEEERARIHPKFFRVFVDLVLEAGHIDMTTSGKAVALWLPMTDDAVDEDGDEQFAAAMREACGAYAERFAYLDKLMTDGHPHDAPHAYLPFIAAAPGHQATGAGTRLLTHRFTELDAAGVPSYLEASSPRNRALYERLGYRQVRPALSLPDGPSLIPMWREPEPRG
jgi:GNAT superfamily N-acetyltransferase